MIYTSNIVPVVTISTRYRKESKILGWVFLMIRVQFCSGSEYLKKIRFRFFIDGIGKIFHGGHL